MVLVYSSSSDLFSSSNQHLFNIGFPIELKGFNLEQVQQLGQCYGLHWNSEKETKQLIEIVEDNPALIHRSIYYLSYNKITLQQLLESSSMPITIHFNYLLNMWMILKNNPDLVSNLNKLMEETSSGSLDPIVAYKLSSLGLIKQKGTTIALSCPLLSQFLTEFLKVTNSNELSKVI